MAALKGTKHLVLAGTTAPVHFFAYPGLPGHPVPEDCTVHVLSVPGEDGVAALEALAELVAPGAEPQVTERETPELPSGPLNPRSMAAVTSARTPPRSSCRVSSTPVHRSTRATGRSSTPSMPASCRWV